MTIRALILERQNEIKNSPDLLGGRAAEILVEVTALLGNINDEIRKRDMEYNKVLLSCFDAEPKANRAKIKAETTEEYQAKREARDTKELTIEIIRSLKYFLKAKEDEFRQSKNL